MIRTNIYRFRRVGRRWLAGALTLAVLGAFACMPVRPALADPQHPFDEPFVALPLVMKDKCMQLRTAGLFGVQMYLGSGHSSPYYQDLIDSGATWTRHVIEWKMVEPTNTTPDQYNWDAVDGAIGIAEEQCYPVVLTIGGNPSWASVNGEGPLTKVGLDELVQFVRAVVERYDGDGIDDVPGSYRVENFELYNEPDGGQSAYDERWGLHPDLYAAMLKAVYPAVKAANPNAQVIFGGIAYDWFTDQDAQHPENNGPFVRSFFDGVLKNGGGAYFDKMNFHFYPLFGGNWTQNFPKDGPGLVEKTAAVRATLTKYGLSKPVIITEAAWHNSGDVPYGSDTLQVRMVIQIYAQGIVAGVPMLAWWPIGDPGAGYQYNSGLVTNGENTTPVRKPAFYAYQAMAREMAGATYVGQIAKDTSDVKAYRFQDGVHGRTVYIAWTNPTDPSIVFGSASSPYKDTTRSTTISVPGSQMGVYDAYWNKIATLTDAGDGKRDGIVKVAINGDPRYIVVEGN